MADNVKMKLVAHHDGKKPGDTVEVDAATAKRLVSGGVAQYATVPEAKKVGAPPEAAATKQD